MSIYLPCCSLYRAILTLLSTLYIVPKPEFNLTFTKMGEMGQERYQDLRTPDGERGTGDAMLQGGVAMTLRRRWQFRWQWALLAPAAVALAALAAAACGGGDDATPTSPAPTATSPAPTATSPAPTATSPSAPGETRVPPTATPTSAIPEPTATRTPVNLGELFATPTPVPSPTPTPTSSPTPTSAIPPIPFYPTGVDDPAEHEPVILSFRVRIAELQDNIAVVQGLLAEYDLLKQSYDQRVLEYVPLWEQYNSRDIGFSAYNAKGDEVRSHWSNLEAQFESLTGAADLIAAPSPALP